MNSKIVVGLAVCSFLVATSLGWLTHDVWIGAQTGALIGTGFVLWWYTKETQSLRKAAEQQVAVAHDTMRATYRPFLLACLTNNSIAVENVGVGPALAPRIVLGWGASNTIVDGLQAEDNFARLIPAKVTVEWKLSLSGVEPLHEGAELLRRGQQRGDELHIQLEAEDLDGITHRFVSAVSELHTSRIVYVESQWAPVRQLLKPRDL
jgi:hypothetical protein